MLGGSNLITFTIDGVQYQAEEGMTWKEWCNSEYNVGGFIYETSDSGYAVYTSDYKKYFISNIFDYVLVTNGQYVTKNVKWPLLK